MIHLSENIFRFISRYLCAAKWRLNYVLHSNAARIPNNASNEVTKKALPPIMFLISLNDSTRLDHHMPNMSLTQTRDTECRKSHLFVLKLPFPMKYLSQTISDRFPYSNKVLNQCFIKFIIDCSIKTCAHVLRNEYLTVIYRNSIRVIKGG